MTKTFTSIAVVALIAAVGASSASAMGAKHSQLKTTVGNNFAVQSSDVNVDALPLSQVVRLKQLLGSDDSIDRQRARRILHN